MIRFQRIGRTNDPAFRVVVTEKRSKPKSGELEILGSFHPKTKETHLKSERILYWLGKGAKLSPRVHNLLVTHKLITAPKINVVKKPKALPSVEAKEPKLQTAA
ncbi:MAG: 30S ribosomal protein S16 [Candidatus Sungiibacteriota bacterium]